MLGRAVVLAAAVVFAAAAPAHAAKIERLSRPGKLSYFAFVEKAETVRAQPKASARKVSKLTKKSPEGTDDLVAVLDRTTVKDKVWLRVRLPIRPNGTTGWVRGSEVQGRDVGERIEVDLSEHRLWRVANGRTVASYVVGVGAADSPTAPGHFFVWARVPSDPAGPYGVFALGLSGFSDVITDWVGGGRLAIHGTSHPSDRGEDVSHGCIRVFNPQMQLLSDVSLGTPVWIHR